MDNIWYTKTFGAKLEELRRLRKNATSLEELNKIDKTISAIESLFENDVQPSSIEEQLKEEKQAFERMNSYLELLNPLASERTPRKRASYNSIPEVTIETLFKLMEEFFKEALDKELYKIFKTMFKDRSRLVYFNNIGTGFKGAEAILLAYYREVYIRLRRTHKIEDLGNLAHEYGHGIESLYNEGFELTPGNILFSEIVSTFFELLCLDYMRTKREFIKASTDYETRIFSAIVDRSKQITAEQIILNNPNLTRKSLDRQIKNSEIFTSDKIYTTEDLLKKESPSYIKYIIGYLIAVEIFMVYVMSKEKGLELLKKVMSLEPENLQNENYEKILTMGIMPNQNIFDYKKTISEPSSRAFKV